MTNFRPKFHFTPDHGYMNDPNGCFYDATTGLYHLYFQYSDKTYYDEYYGSWIHKDWGHAVSKDLCSFKEVEPAITRDEMGLIWSGTMVIDRENVSGVFPDSIAKDRRLVAFYPCANQKPINGNGQLCVCGAYSLDGGYTFTKFKENPLIKNENNFYAEAFGDPKVFYLKDDYYPDGGIWVMFTVLDVRIFTSKDLIHWNFESAVTYKGNPLSSECPGVFETVIKGKHHYVYSGAGKYFCLGDFKHVDGHLEFEVIGDKHEISRGNMYANQQFVYAPDNRIIMMGWMRDQSGWDFRKFGKTWDGYQTIPMEVTLYEENSTLKTKFYPVKELENLRGENVLSINEKTVKNTNIFEKTRLITFDLEMELDVSETEFFELDFRVEKEEKTRLTFNKNKKEVELNTYLSGLLIHEHHHIPVSLENNVLKIRLLVDNSVIDLFVDEGVNSKSILFFPELESDKLNLEVKGNLLIKKLNLYRID